MWDQALAIATSSLPVEFLGSAPRPGPVPTPLAEVVDWVPTCGQCSLAELLQASPGLSTLLALLRLAGLADLLSQPAPLTILAPINQAWDKLPAQLFQVPQSQQVWSVGIQYVSKVPTSPQVYRTLALAEMSELFKPTVELLQNARDTELVW